MIEQQHHNHVDQIARRTAAKLITDLATGLISTDEYELAFPERSKDPALFAIFMKLWGFYDDLHEHRLEGKWALDPVARELWGRCVLFLQTDAPFRWPAGPYMKRLLNLLLGRRNTTFVGDESVWPFSARQELEDAIRDAGGGRLPLKADDADARP